MDLAGQNFGKLTVLNDTRSRLNRKEWACECECGKKTWVATYRLNAGVTTSCGCRKKEAAKENCFKNSFKPTHGMAKTRIHKIWSGMIDRCESQYKDKQNYYDRGISVCERWKIFENFYDDMGEAPIGMSIDRIDVNGNYSPENCRWASAKTQQNNRTNTRYLNINGEKVPLMEFADKIGVKKSEAQYAYTFMKKIHSLGLKISVWEN